ncbi:MAG: hypothetical protein WKG06_33130 [Segetibacter sp.]
MNLNHYDISKHKTKENIFEFISEGVKNISKVVELQPTNIPEVYNLAMADKIRGKISYTHVSNNKDAEKVMETVGYIIQLYTLEYPQRRIFVTGNTPVKMRLSKCIYLKIFPKFKKSFMCGDCLSPERILNYLQKIKIMLVSW